MKNTKRIISAVCAIVMAAGMTGMQAAALNDIQPESPASVCLENEEQFKTTEDGFVYFPLDDGKQCYVADYVGTAEDLVIPEKLDGLKVAGFYSEYEEDYGFHKMKNIRTLTIKPKLYAIPSIFDGCDELEKVVLPDSVESICDRAFMWCPKLKEVNIPSKLSEVGVNAFAGSPWLEELAKKEGLVIFGKELFYARYAEGDVVIPDTVTTIMDEAFWGNEAMTSLTIPGSVIRVGGYAVYGCKNLEKITVCNGVKGLGRECFCGNPKLKKLILPPSIVGCTTKPVSGKYRKITTIYYYKGTYMDDFLHNKAEFKYKLAVFPGTTKSLRAVPVNKKKIKVVWKKVSTASGYQVQIAADSKFKKNCRTVTAKGRTKIACKITGLTSGKKYYIRQRSYRVVGGKKYYGDYTKTIAIKMK